MQGDMISRSAHKKHIMSFAGMFTDELGFAVSLAQVIMAIDAAPAIDAEPVRHGSWEPIEEQHWNCEFMILVAYKCSECGKEIAPNKENYCPNCGAKMRGDVNA